VGEQQGLALGEGTSLQQREHVRPSSLAILYASFKKGRSSMTIRPELFLPAWAEHMTGNAVLAIEFEPWLLMGAALKCKRAARVEAAP
jgi:hypothetical protein